MFFRPNLFCEPIYIYQKFNKALLDIEVTTLSTLAFFSCRNVFPKFSPKTFQMPEEENLNASVLRAISLLTKKRGQNVKMKAFPCITSSVSVNMSEKLLRYIFHLAELN